MMTGRLSVWLRARVRDERGFGLVETIVAVTVIFGSLLALAYTATAGFTYQDIARQRQTANGVANQIMEDVRGLAYDRLTTGLLDGDLSTDPTYIKNCGGSPVVYRYLTCTLPPIATTGAGEKIVHSAGATNPTSPLVPHHGTTTVNNITYDYWTYVTVDDSVGNAPYRVTVRVSWTGGATGANKSYQFQSFFYSPAGCRGTSTHPFAAPCQPFFFGSAAVPQGDITLSGSVQSLSFQSGDIFLPSASSGMEVEQLAQVQGGFTSPLAQLTTTGGTTTVGGVEGNALADSDPGTTTVSTYSRQRCPTELACTGGTVSSVNGGASMVFTVPANSTAETDAAVTAVGASVCPPPTATAETDSLPCAGTRIQQVGALTAIGTVPAIGSFTLVNVAAPGSPSTAVANRQLYPSTTGCSPASGESGCLALSASRTVGTLNLGGLPPRFEPTGWAGANPWNGYFLSIVNYTDTASASLGTGSPLASAALSSGSLYYWDPNYGLHGGYQGPISLTAAALNGLNVSSSFKSTDITTQISTDPTQMARGTTSAVTTPSTSGNATRTDATAQVVPPVLAIRYLVSTISTTYVDMTIVVRLGTLEARGSYAPAPAQGS
jgi:type II secretory pathway pseudopilin PulG